MLDAPDTPKVKLLGPAPEPLNMVISRHFLVWIPGGTMLGFLLGLSLGFLIEMLNDLVRTASTFWSGFRAAPCSAFCSVCLWDF